MLDPNLASDEDRVVIDVHLHVDEATELNAIADGLDASPRTVNARYFYDEVGSQLFDRICSLPEYYQTRTERHLLMGVAPGVVRQTGAGELMELGSGMSTKTRVLLDAMDAAGQLERYVPFDVSEATLRQVALELVDEYPDLSVHGVAGDFTLDIRHIPRGQDRLTLFLGGTIGNFLPDDAAAFLADVADTMCEGDHLLLGTDLVKDPSRLEAAYNDSEGITAEFNRNSLRHLNRRLDADFVPDAFEHRAFYDAEHHRIEMWLHARARQVVYARKLAREFAFEAGEGIRTEVSVKFDRPRVEALLAAAGFEFRDWFVDSERLFALTLARRGAETPPSLGG